MKDSKNLIIQPPLDGAAITRQGSKGSRSYRTRDNPTRMAYIETDLNCCKKLSISAGGDIKKLRRLSRMLRHLLSIA